MQWDDPRLRVDGEPSLRAKYRLLQSWYRETILGLAPSPPAKGPRKAPVGNWIPPIDLDGAEQPNFLSKAAVNAVMERRARTDWGGGMLDPERLHRNLLSSQPLCFNLFGELDQHRGALAQALRASLGLPVEKITAVRIEWAPDRSIAIGGASFDAFIEYDTQTGKRGFVGVETKYTEDLTPQQVKPSQRELYLAVTMAEDSGFVGDCAAVFGTESQQFLINACMALGVRTHGSYAVGHAVVLHLSEDRAARSAVDRLEALRGDGFICACSLETFVLHLGGVDMWRRRFIERYLDLGPIAHAV